MNATPDAASSKSDVSRWLLHGQEDRPVPGKSGLLSRASFLKILHSCGAVALSISRFSSCGVLSARDQSTIWRRGSENQALRFFIAARSHLRYGRGASSAKRKRTALQQPTALPGRVMFIPRVDHHANLSASAARGLSEYHNIACREKPICVAK